MLASATVPQADIPVTGGAYVSVPFAWPAPVVAGTPYAIVIHAPGPDSAKWDISVADPYAAGALLQSSDAGGGWSPYALDARFRTYVTVAALAVGGGSVLEGNGGVRTLVFPVFTTLAFGADVTASYTLADGSATGGPACAPGVDFINTGGTVTVTAGSTVGSIVVPVCGDADFEPDEGLTVTLSGPAHAVLGGTQALGTIQNDDLAPTATPTPTLTPTPSRPSWPGRRLPRRPSG